MKNDSYVLVCFILVFYLVLYLFIEKGGKEFLRFMNNSILKVWLTWILFIRFLLLL